MGLMVEAKLLACIFLQYCNIIHAMKYVYEDKWIKIRVDEVGQSRSKRKYTVVERADAVAIVLVTPTNKTLLLDEFRYPINSSYWGLPMGGVDNGESPMQAATRELAEETGIKNAVMKEIGIFYPVPGLSPQKVTVFIAKLTDEELEKAHIGKSEIDLKRKMILSIENLRDMIRKSKITDGFTLSTFAILDSFLEGASLH